MCGELIPPQYRHLEWHNSPRWRQLCRKWNYFLYFRNNHKWELVALAVTLRSSWSLRRRQRLKDSQAPFSPTKSHLSAVRKPSQAQAARVRGSHHSDQTVQRRDRRRPPHTQWTWTVALSSLSCQASLERTPSRASSWTAAIMRRAKCLAHR